MKNEYHYTIARTDRIYLIIFVLLLLSWELIKVIFPGEENFYTFTPGETTYTPTSKKSFKNYDNWNSRSYARQDQKKENNYKENARPPGKPVAIATATIDELISTGLSRKVAYNIHKFKAAGGEITDTKALLKIYGMDSAQLGKALPYLILDTVHAFVKKEWSNKIKTPLNVIDLNSATSEELETLNGIGQILAERIIKFRESLGGFYTAEQLRECYGISPEVFEEIKGRLAVSGTPSKIIINDTDLTTITHPYITKKMVRLLVSYQKQHGVFADAADLKKVYPPDTNWCMLLLPYIDFKLE